VYLLFSISNKYEKEIVEKPVELYFSPLFEEDTCNPSISFINNLGIIMVKDK
jgi:hypothetical protein